MARPTLPRLVNGALTWDAAIDAAWDIIDSGPFPVVQYPNVAGLPAAGADNEDCLMTEDTGHELIKSDGTEHRTYGKGQILASGARANRVVKTVHLTGLAGATVTSAGFFPAGSTNRQLTLRVTTLVTGATSFDVGDGTDVDLFAAAVALAAGTTKTPADRTSLSGAESIAAKDVVLTANGMNFSGGEVRLVGVYDELTAPTS